MRKAVIGIGSNSIRLLVSDINYEKRALDRILRDREGTRLFSGLDENGELSREKMEAAVEAVGRMRREAQDAGSDEISLFATSAVRDSRNSGELVKMLKDVCGLDLIICSGETEARLSFYGCCSGGKCGMIDIGGGSTEFTWGESRQIKGAVSLQLGAVRLFERYPVKCSGDLAPVLEYARELIKRELLSRSDFAKPESWVGCGGTFTTLSALCQNVSWTQRRFTHGYIMPKGLARAWMYKLADMPIEKRLQLRGLQPNRADIVGHGIAILVSAMDEIGIDEIRVSEHGNLDGFLKSKYLYPETWRL
ncbi:MAG: Ppx/GppA phosphatase family protein [Eubacteriales bacterium]|nr:Ppx/GppA phosphatase family protein [Eubacteriales bacterium]MDD3881160.1 Ppx/GppA phosphatase family protein [Eubacteriales bacterium]MDD4511542.1 Ppx/GppA phosphatase family protein [Eubacteriales bacterium]